MDRNFSVGAFIGYIGGIILITNGLYHNINNREKAGAPLKEIYKILNYGFGVTSLVIGSIAQNTKDLNE